jgi:hypothetical protein
VLADNKLALNAGWDLEMLSLEIGELGEAGFDISLTGFDEFELGELFAESTQGRTDANASFFTLSKRKGTPASFRLKTRPGRRWTRSRRSCGSSSTTRRRERRGAGRRPRGHLRRRGTRSIAEIPGTIAMA